MGAAKLDKPVEAKEKAQKAIDYERMEKARTAALQAQLKERLKGEFGSGTDGLRRVVLKSVVIGDYEKANQSLDNYIVLKEDYPDFHPRVADMVRHCRELINAVRSKRNLPGLSQLSMAKQKEIMDHVVNHFNELKYSLKAIEKVAKDVALSDIRSTVWLMQTTSYGVLAIVATYFLVTFTSDIGGPFWVVFNDISNIIFESLVGFLGL